MAKATITIEDIEGDKNAININYDFIPEIPTSDEDPDVIETADLTSAQILAMHLFDFIQISLAETRQAEAEAQEENCDKTEEGTCCGGACDTPAEG
jgi:hypothetical protein